MKPYRFLACALTFLLSGATGASGESSGAEDSLTLQLNGLPVEEAIQLVGRALDRNVVIGPGVDGSVALAVRDIPPHDAWNALLQTHNLRARRTGPVWLVVPAGSRRPQTQLRLVPIRHARAGEVSELLASAHEQTGRVGVWPDKRTNQLLVSGEPHLLDTLVPMIRSLDRPAQQVLLESRVVVAQSNLFNRLGVSWKGRSAGTPSELPGTWAGIYPVGDNAGDAVATRTPRTMFASLATSLTDAASGGAGVNLGVLRNGAVLALELEALEGSGELEIISQPEILTSDGHRAEIASGSSIPFPGPEGGTEFVDALLSLSATPRVAGGQQIILDLKVRQDSPTGGGSDNISTNSLETRVRVRNGETLVLGGVFRHEVAQDRTAVPGLSRLPWVGSLFQWNRRRDVRHELMIFITPRLVGSDAESTVTR